MTLDDKLREIASDKPYPEPKATWMGKPLDEYTKQELIEIVIELGRMSQQEHYEHARELDVLSKLLRREA